jgi:hypothetical protein
MDIADYETPEPDILRDDYEPRPKASQHVAAFHRAKASRPTHDTEPIQPIALPSTTRKYVPFGIGALVLIVLMIGAATYQLSHIESSKPLQITPQATVLPTDAPAAAVSAPAPTSGPAATPATIGAYAAPDGQLLGPIELDRTIVPVAHYGSVWIQADVTGSGLVWLRAGDVPDIAITGPDLAPVAQQPAAQPQVSSWQPPVDPPVAAEPAKGQKAADDRAARHAAAVARDQQQPQHGSK